MLTEPNASVSLLAQACSLNRNVSVQVENSTSTETTATGKSILFGSLF